MNMMDNKKNKPFLWLIFKDKFDGILLIIRKYAIIKIELIYKII